MRLVRSPRTQTITVSAFVLLFSLIAAGQGANTPAHITQSVNEENLVTLRGNSHPLARPEYDQGAAPDSLPVERVLLVLQRSGEQEAALRKLLDEQQIKSSPNYHMWLTPEQFGQQFGPADADIQAVTGWLTSQGFQVSHVAAGRTIIEFSGTAGQVRQAFHTEIHKFVVNGEEHWANASDPQIPAALTPVVAGFASLNNFPKRPAVHRLGTFSRSKATGVVTPLFTFHYGNGYLLAVGPTDFATIYNVLPLWSGGYDGTGQTIAVSEQSDINLQDVTDFRNMFGLRVSANNVQPIYNGPDPGVVSTTGDETEAALDVQWAGAVAKGATVDLVVSETTTTTMGVDLSALYIIDNNLAPVMSESYGSCEAFNGNSGNEFYYTLWEQGAAQGITIVIAAGDSGSAGCDSADLGESAAINGLEVYGDASTPFNVAVGGTDFNYTGTNWQQFWNITNGSGQSSALSYIPEMTWNDTCASAGVNGCSSWDGSTPGLAAGSGGPSNCATSELETSYGVTYINCEAGVPKPAWQSGPGVPSDTVRDVPDVSLFAADGYTSGSFYVFCEMDANTGGTNSCDLNALYQTFQGAGGTSFAAPSFAGIMAMVNQKTGQRQGNANYVLYPLAAQTSPNCVSNSFMAPTASASSCIFYDVQVGNNSVACEAGSLNCGNQTGGYGILVNPNTAALQPAWLAGAGYDLATGLGTVNAANLVNNWTSASFTSTTTKLTISPTTLVHGQSATLTVNVTPASATGDVSLTGGPNNSNLGITFATLSNGAINTQTILLPGGTYGVTAHYEGTGTYGASNSTPVQVTVTPESSQTFLQFDNINSSGVTYGATSAVYGTPELLHVGVTNSSSNACFSTSGTGLPTYQCPAGQVTVTDNGGPPTDLGAPSGTPGTYTLNSQGIAEDQYIQFPGGTRSVVATYAGNSSYKGSTSGPLVLTITPAATAIGSVIASAAIVPAGASVSLTTVVSASSYGLAPSGTVQFLNQGGAILGTPTYTPANGLASGYASLTATLTTSFTANASITAEYLGDQNYAASAVSAPVTITVTAAPVVSLSPTSLTFLAQKVGTSSSAQSVTLSNTGSAVLSITSITPSGDFSQTNNCGSSVGVGASCTVSVTFTPTAFGTRTGAVTITDNAGSAIQTVSLTGTGSAPVVSLSPASLTFRAQAVDTSSSAQSVTLKNTGSATLSITSITASGDFSQTHTCGSSLAASASCTVRVIFKPTATGTRSGAVTITDNASPATQTVSLTGTGVQPVPTLSELSPSSATVGGAALTLTVTGTNFVSGATVKWNGTGLKTTYVSDTKLTAAVLANDIATTGTASVTVMNPTPGGGTSSGLTFTIDNPKPVATSLSPSSATAGGAAFTLAVTGTNFVSGSTVQWNGSPRTTALLGAELVAEISASDIATGGTVSVTVKNPTPGGGTSNSVSFTVKNLVPTITSLSPTWATAGAAAQTLTINGTNFLSTSTVTYNRVAHTPTLVNSKQLKITLSASDQATGGTYAVVVTNPAPGGGASNSVSFTVKNRVPTITTLSPTSATVGGAAFTLTVTGTNFVSTSKVQWKGTGLTTKYVSGTKLTASVPASDIATAGTASVTVMNPTPGGGTSSGLTFTIDNPKPTATSLSPSSATAGGAAFTLTVTGTNFVSTSKVEWKGAGLTTTYVSGTKLTASVPATDIATAGTATVTVVNPTPGGGTSSGLTFTVNKPPLVSLSALSLSFGSQPLSRTSATQTETVTNTGTGNLTIATVTIGGTNARDFATSADTCTGATVKPNKTCTVSVTFTPSAAGSRSASLNFTDNASNSPQTVSLTGTGTGVNPVPKIGTISPSTGTAGGAAFTLTVTGTNFVSTSKVEWKGTGLTTTYVSSTQVTASVPASDIATAGTATVTVMNPTPGGGTSSGLTFIIR